MATHTHSIHLENQKQYDELMIYLGKLGYRWSSSFKNPSEDTNRFGQTCDYILCLKEDKSMKHSIIGYCKIRYPDIPITSFHEFICPIRPEFEREFKRIFRVNRVPNPLTLQQEETSRKNNWLMEK